MADSPNVVFIHTDEQRADSLGCYGNDAVDTRNVDGLAAEGATLENAHCTHPLCMPSRGTLLTGRYPSVHGQWRNGIPLPDSEITVAELFRDAGYATGLLGKAHFTPYQGDPERHPESVQMDVVGEETCWEFWDNFDGPYYGFDHVRMSIAHGDNGIQGGHYGRWLAENHPDERAKFSQDAAVGETDPNYNSWTSAVPVDVHSSAWVTDQIIEFIEMHTDDRPFFAWVGIPDPHFPYDPPKEYAAKYDPENVPLPVDPQGDHWDDELPRYIQYHLDEKYGIDWREMSESKQREIIANYYAMVDLVDDQVGCIVDTLRAEGVLDETIIVYTSDHGDWLGDHGLFQKGLPHTRGLTRIPWIVRWPDVADPGCRVEGVASHLDLVPTLLDAADIDIPYGVQGESLRSVLAGEADQTRPFALVEHRHEAFREDSFFVQQNSGGVREDAVQDDIINWTDEDTNVRTIYTDRYRLSYVTGIKEKYGELYDLEADPDDRGNLWHENPDLRRRLLPTLVEALIHADNPLPERRYPV